MPNLTEVTDLAAKAAPIRLAEMYRLSDEIRNCENTLNANKAHLFRMLPINEDERISWARCGRNGDYRFIYFNSKIDMERPVGELPLEPRIGLYEYIVKLVETLTEKES